MRAAFLLRTMKLVARFRSPMVAVGLVILGIAIAIAATRLSFLQGTPPTGSVRREPAPEFAGIAEWLNSPPLTIRGLRGKVVLIDFWAYSCVNCVRTWPALRQLYERYEPSGLEIVGVHSPEFDFEKSESNVRDAITRNNLSWPIAMDNEMETWRAYRNNYWPRVYLIDASGTIRFDHIGEGGDDLIQTRLRSLLRENGAQLPEPVVFAEAPPNPHLTREIYAGIERGSVNGSIGNPEGYRRDREVDYPPVDGSVIRRAGTAGMFFLEGRWRARDEYLEAAEDGARLVLPYFARDVFFVAAAGSPVEVRLLLDGRTVPPPALGADARDGSVRVTRSDLYRLIVLQRPQSRELTLIAGKGFRLYTFTFG